MSASPSRADTSRIIFDVRLVPTADIAMMKSAGYYCGSYRSTRPTKSRRPLGSICLADFQNLTLLPYYLNSNRLAPLAGTSFAAVVHRSLAQNSGERAFAMHQVSSAGRCWEVLDSRCWRCRCECAAVIVETTATTTKAAMRAPRTECPQPH
jgi:hypothetical protein